MVKAHLAVLLIGLSAKQAFTSNEDRERHWAEGVYFPPSTAPSIIGHNSSSKESYSVRQTRRQKWLVKSQHDSVNPHPSPDSFGYPVDGYDPYRPTGVRSNNDGIPGHTDEYVPEDYSPSTQKEHDGGLNGYRLNGFDTKWNHPTDAYLNNLDGNVQMHRRQKQQDTHYGPVYDLAESDRLDGVNLPQNDLDGYPYTLSLDRSLNLSNPYSRILIGTVPYDPDWGPSLFVEEFRTINSPWELMLPFSNFGLPNYLLW